MCNKTFQCLISRRPNFHGNGKISFKNFCLELGAPALGSPHPGLCPRCPAHCCAAGFRPPTSAASTSCTIARLIESDVAKRAVNTSHVPVPLSALCTQRETKSRYDTRCCFSVRSKAGMSRLNLPHGNRQLECVKTEK